jgi:heme-degrading monooxygenase HmoA
MHAVIFEVRPLATSFASYLSIAKSLKPELEAVPGFLENIRYKSLTRPGWLLSLSYWSNEKALVRWRTKEKHHAAQEKGREGILEEYYLKVGQVMGERRGGETVSEEHISSSPVQVEETEVGRAKMVVLVDGLRVEDGDGEDMDPVKIARDMGLDDPGQHDNLVAWDVMDAVLSPGDMILLTSWVDAAAAGLFVDKVCATGRGLRARSVGIVRDYGKYDRREAPQFYEDAQGRETIH